MKQQQSSRLLQTKKWNLWSIFGLLCVGLLAFAACDDDEEDHDGSGGTYYVTLKFHCNDNIDKSSVNGVVISITNPNGSKSDFSSPNVDDWRTIFYDGTWGFDVTAKGRTGSGASVDVWGSQNAKFTSKDKDGTLTIELYADKD